MKASDLFHAALVGEQVLEAIVTIAEGQPGSTQVSWKGKSYTVTITPQQ